MISLRPYQRAAIDATYAYWNKEGGSPLVELATGLGKSIVIAKMIQELMVDFPSMRVLCLVHVKELVMQDAQALIKVWPSAPIGINCAGLGRRDTKHPIVFASVQSVERHAQSLGRRDLIIIDEAHLLPHGSNGRYHNLINEMKDTTSPDLRLWGCTATPYRLDSGRLDQGENRLFDRIVYSFGIAQGIAEGFLARLVSKETKTSYDVSGVAKRGGEFVPGALAAAVDQENITKAAVAEMVAYGRDRRSWLAFATSVAHAHHIKDEIRSYGISCEVVSAETPSRERDKILTAFKNGSLRCVSNMAVLTTGFDAPSVDMIALMRPTLSPGLLVQMIGRGTRNAPNKNDCLILDFSQNIASHGPVDEIDGPDHKEKSMKGDMPTKTCQHCLSINPISVKQCVDCDNPFPEKDGEEKLEHTASALPILSGRTSPLDWRDVDSVTYTRHEKFGVPDAPATLRVSYYCGRKVFSEYLCFDHPTGSFPRKKAETWWRARGGKIHAPASVARALDRVDDEIPKVKAIRVTKADGYDRVVAHRMAGGVQDPLESVLSET